MRLFFFLTTKPKSTNRNEERLLSIWLYEKLEGFENKPTSFLRVCGGHSANDARKKIVRHEWKKSSALGRRAWRCPLFASYSAERIWGRTIFCATSLLDGLRRKEWPLLLRERNPAGIFENVAYKLIATREQHNEPLQGSSCHPSH